MAARKKRKNYTSNKLPTCRYVPYLFQTNETRQYQMSGSSQWHSSLQGRCHKLLIGETDYRHRNPHTPKIYFLLGFPPFNFQATGKCKICTRVNTNNTEISSVLGRRPPNDFSTAGTRTGGRSRAAKVGPWPCRHHEVLSG